MYRPWLDTVPLRSYVEIRMVMAGALFPTQFLHPARSRHQRASPAARQAEWASATACQHDHSRVAGSAAEGILNASGGSRVRFRFRFGCTRDTGHGRTGHRQATHGSLLKFRRPDALEPGQLVEETLADMARAGTLRRRLLLMLYPPRPHPPPIPPLPASASPVQTASRSQIQRRCSTTMALDRAMTHCRTRVPCGRDGARRPRWPPWRLDGRHTHMASSRPPWAPASHTTYHDARQDAAARRGLQTPGLPGRQERAAVRQTNDQARDADESDVQPPRAGQA